MTAYAVTHPVATLSRKIEDLVILGENSENILVRGTCAAVSRLVSLVVFPIFLLIELAFKRIPKMILSIGDPDKFNKKFDKVIKFALAFLFSPLALHSPEGLPGFFLKTSPADKASRVAPFGVERIFGRQMDRIHTPETVDALQQIVIDAKESNKQISIIGAGMSQGPQTVPVDSNQVVINTKNLNRITLAQDGRTVTVQSGATWEQLQLTLNQHGKSSIVKQASDPFSIGGSIGINCHGWAHEYGAIASTVESLTVINAEGELQILTPDDELFGCFFGTLGYFGVIVDVTLKIVDNEHLIEKTEEIDIAQFHENYKTKIQGKNIPLFGGRLVLDNLEGPPLRKVCMVRYERDTEATATAIPSPNFSPEPSLGTRIERIGLKLFAHFSNFSVRRLTSWFWERERAAMLEGRRLTRNEALHPPINAFAMLHHSNLHAQWLQEYFIKEENIADFLRYLGPKLKANDVRLLNATIRPTPRDPVSILPYAEQDRYAVVLSFAQVKSEREIAKTKRWIEEVNQHLLDTGDVYYQAYMPYTTREQFEQCYGKETVDKMRQLKAKYDPANRFGNAHTRKYFDQPQETQ